MGGHLTHRTVKRPRQQRQYHGGACQRRKTKLAVDQQPQRRACRQRAVNRHPVPGHHFSGTRRSHQPHSPGQGAGQQLAFAKAEDQAPYHQQREFIRCIYWQQRRQQPGSPRQPAGKHALQRRAFCAVLIRQATGVAPG